jgi:DNA-binding LacI/PurR family transcriptional regulator
MPGKTITRKSRINVTDVARMAGVAHSTVSRVLNNNPNVSPRTRERILQTISLTGYKPFSSARSLVSQRHDTIGLIFEREHVNTSYGAPLIEGVCEKLSETGHRLAMGMVPWGAQASEIEKLPLLRTLSVDGMILDVAKISGDIDAVMARLNLPHVFVNPSGSRRYNAVMPDDVDAAEQATRYMIERGHRRIGYMPCGRDVSHSSQPDRMKGYAQTMVRAGLTPIPLWDTPIRNNYSAEDDYFQRVKTYHERHACTAFVAYSSEEAIRALMGCYRLGLKVPEELALVSCDLHPSVLLSPIPIASVFLSRFEMGQRAVDIVLQRIRHPESDVPVLLYKGKLVEDPLAGIGASGLLRIEGVAGQQGEENETKNQAER